MPRLLLGAVGVLLIPAGGLSAFEVEATLKKVDADNGVVVVAAGGQDRTLRVPRDARVLDGEGKELADGLKAKELKEGTPVVLTAERQDGKPVLRSIRLVKKSEKPATAGEVAKVDTSGLTPLTDLGPGEYRGFQGGLYPDGKNERPARHEAAGRALAEQVRPLDADGKPSADGKIVLLGIGFSNTVQVFSGFMQEAAADRQVSPRVVLVNGAVGGRSANMIQDPDDGGRGTEYWKTVDERLRAAGVTRAQVQVVWIKETNPAPHEGNFPKYIRALESELTRIVQVLPRRFPNVKLTYLSSRTYGGWAKAAPGRSVPGNSEPYSYETGFAVKWLIERQLKADPALNYNPAKGAVKAPWLSWGPYLWANGERKRKDGFRFEPSDFRENDRMHHSPQGQKKTGAELLRFFKTDPTTRGWFVKAGE
jgi:hypothetical protein